MRDESGFGCNRPLKNRLKRHRDVVPDFAGSKNRTVDPSAFGQPVVEKDREGFFNGLLKERRRKMNRGMLNAGVDCLASFRQNGLGKVLWRQAALGQCHGTGEIGR
jgi:hypothetical protein